MLKKLSYALLILAITLMVSPVAYGDAPQDELDKEIAAFAERAIRQSSPDDLYLMKWEINENGDTIFTEELRPARVFALTYRANFFCRLGFRIVSKELFPQKIWSDCSVCPKKDRCDETAVLMEL